MFHYFFYIIKYRLLDFDLGRVYYKLRKYKEAKKYFNKAIALNRKFLTTEVQDFFNSFGNDLKSSWGYKIVLWFILPILLVLFFPGKLALW
ncbi:MAG: tetratricopeptide repeat protein [bacterium]|nr:tetratricopeptide repeat protein [bacterium]